MNNLDYLEKLKKDNFREFVIKSAKADLESRRLLALEIIAEELCKLNNPIVKVEMLKTKIQLQINKKKTLNGYMKKTSI